MRRKTLKKQTWKPAYSHILQKVFFESQINSAQSSGKLNICIEVYNGKSQNSLNLFH